MINGELEYPFWQRIIPFSSLARVIGSRWTGVRVNLDAEAIVASIPDEPVDAHVTYTDGELVVVKAQEGFELDDVELARKLGEVRLALAAETKIKIKAERKAYEISDEDVARFAENLPRMGEEMAGGFVGRTYAVMAVGMNGGWEMGVSKDRVYTSASTYKLFVAYSMLKAVESGAWKWSDSLNGTTLERCFEIMIVDSDNGCPDRWNNKVGFAAVNAKVQEIGGLKNTQIAPGNMRTTAADLAVYLTKLYRGELYSEANTEKLLGLMKRQRHRDGVPAGVGSSAVAVADKPGWGVGNWDGTGIVINDAAIVYHEKGDYVLVVMSSGGTWGGVAGVAGKVVW